MPAPWSIFRWALLNARATESVRCRYTQAEGLAIQWRATRRGLVFLPSIMGKAAASPLMEANADDRADIAAPWVFPPTTLA